MSAFLGALLAASKSVASAVLLFAWAAVLGWWGAFDQKLLSQLARLVKLMFLPCLIFGSVANGVSIPFIIENWLLVVMGVLVIFVGFVLGQIVVVLARVPLELRPWYVLAIAFPNMIALPLVLVEALCFEQESTPGAIAECIESATTRLFTVCLSHTILLWVFGYSYAKSYITKAASPIPHATAIMDAITTETTSPLEDDASDEVVDVENKHESVQPPSVECTDGALACIHTAFMSRTVPSCVLGRSHDLPSTTNSKMHSFHPNIEGNMCEGMPVSQPASADIPKNIKTKKIDDNTTCSHAKLLLRMALLENPPVVANLLALAVGFWPTLKELLYGQSAPLSFIASGVSVLGKASPAITNLISGGTFGLQLRSLRSDDRLGLKCLGLSPSAMVLLVSSRLILAPLLIFVLLIAMSDFLPDDRWSRLVLYFQPAGVTANMITVLATLLEQPKAAKLIAMAAIPQILLYIPVSTGFITIGLAMGKDLA